MIEIDNANKWLKMWPETIDISDGVLMPDNGFYSQTLSIAWRNAETAIGEDDFMTWIIYKVLHELARKKYANDEYTVSIHEIDVNDLEKKYEKEKAQCIE